MDRMGQFLDAALDRNYQLALVRLEDAPGDAFGGSVTLAKNEQLGTFGWARWHLTS